MKHVSYPHKEIWKDAFLIALLTICIPCIVLTFTFFGLLLLPIISPILYAFYYIKTMKEFPNSNTQV
jgi:hypothetical protein